ncbi:hypothetical protein VPH35_002459 [Triticum aestivum]
MLELVLVLPLRRRGRLLRRRLLRVHGEAGVLRERAGAPVLELMDLRRLWLRRLGDGDLDGRRRLLHVPGRRVGEPEHGRIRLRLLGRRGDGRPGSRAPSSAVEVEERADPPQAIVGLEDDLGGAELEHAGAEGDADHGAEAEGVGLPGPLAGRAGEPRGDPGGLAGEERLARQAHPVGEGLGHGDEEEPLGVRDLLLDGLVGRGGASPGYERVELPEDALAVLLLGGGGRGGLLAALVGVVAALVVAVAPAEERGAGVGGGLPEDGVGPGLPGALDDGLQALLQRVLVEGRLLRHGGRRRRGGRRAPGEGRHVGGGHEGLHHGGVVVRPQVHRAGAGAGVRGGGGRGMDGRERKQARGEGGEGEMGKVGMDWW